MTNTACFTMSAKAKAKWEKKGAVVEVETNLPPHLRAIIEKRATEMAAFDMFEVTLDMDKVDGFHPLHAVIS